MRVDWHSNRDKRAIDLQRSLTKGRVHEIFRVWECLLSLLYHLCRDTKRGTTIPLTSLKTAPTIPRLTGSCVLQDHTTLAPLFILAIRYSKYVCHQNPTFACGSCPIQAPQKLGFNIFQKPDYNLAYFFGLAWFLHIIMSFIVTKVDESDSIFK